MESGSDHRGDDELLWSDILVATSVLVTGKEEPCGKTQTQREIPEYSLQRTDH